MSLPSLPDSLALRGRLISLLRDSEPGFGQLVEFDRQPNIFRSAFPSEIVTCRFDDGRELQLLVKYGVPNHHTGHGYWGGIEYEADVYRYLIGPLSVSAPKFYGAVIDNGTQNTCLVLEYVGGSWRLDKSPEASVVQAARWLGQFHAAGEPLISRDVVSFLSFRDLKYYVGWARRTSLYAEPLHHHYPWLSNLCMNFEDAVSVLVSGSLTTVHGEYYPQNILVRGSTIYPVDWQSAAIARGEVDLASLTEGWGDHELVNRCECEYERTRWPNGAPGDFHVALGLARVSWPLRWLGDKPEWTIHPSRRGYFDLLRFESERAGLL